MTERVRRGLGLVVVAVIAVLITALMSNTDAAGSGVVDVLTVLAGWVALIAGLGGLVLIALGLLRD